jgi:hypothetical protein
MKKLLALPLLLVLLCAQTQVQTVPGSGGPLNFDSAGKATLGTGNLSSTGPAPVLSSCGGGSPAITGSNLAGTVTTGTTATGCVITFAQGGFATAPSCVLSPASGVLASFSYTISTTAITVTQTSSSGNTITYVCVGKQ